MPITYYSDANDTVTINSPGSYDLIFLGGNDTLTVFQGSVNAAMGEGNDVVSMRGGYTVAYGESGEDRFEIYVGGNAYGGGDNDLFNLRGGSDIIAYGDLGDDRFNFAAATSSVLLHGGGGNDDFAGYNFASSGFLYGDSGNDSYAGFRAGVNLYGGPGNDTYRVNPVSNAGFLELVDEGKDTVQLMRGADYTLPDNIENVVVGTYPGSDLSAATITGNALDNAFAGHGNDETFHGLTGNDRAFGKAGNDTLNGNEGNDLLDGGAGNDVLFGGFGNDSLVGRTGDDAMAGGPGNDTYYIDSFGDVVTEFVGAGIDTERSTITTILADNVENGVVIGSAAVNIYGNSINNIITGGAGDNLLAGAAADDILSGGAGIDTLMGETGADSLLGGAGNDNLHGGGGVDTLTGGSDDDIFYFDFVSDSTPSGRDVILDYEGGVSNDTIHLTGIDADTTTAGDQNFHFAGGLTGTPGDLWLQDHGDGTTTIYGDVNGDAVADLQIEVTIISGIGIYIYL